MSIFYQQPFRAAVFFINTKEREKMSKKKKGRNGHPRHNTPKDNNQTSTAPKSIAQAQEVINAKVAESDLKRDAYIQKIDNFVSVTTHALLAFLKLLLYIVICIVLIISLFLFVYLVIAYFANPENPNLVKITTIFQVISGFISIAIGIWGIMLSYQASKNTSVAKTPINTTTIPSVVKANGTNDQVNIDSIE